MQMTDIEKLDWNKTDELLPAIIQHAHTGAVLMLGYMNREALERTIKGGRAVFYSRSRKRLWQKGETSGNYLQVESITPDCDNDTLLILATPMGPTCHRGTPTCFAARPAIAAEDTAFLTELQSIIGRRIADNPQDSYTARLFSAGAERIAQKIGEEGVELALAAMGVDDSRIVGESADLVYHLLLLLKSRNLSLEQVTQELRERHDSRTRTAHRPMD